MFSEYILNLLILICIYSIFALSLQLIMGFGGISNLGCHTFFGIGAYTMALLLEKKFSFGFCVFVSVSIPAFAGWLLSMLTTKLEGEYKSLATLGFSFMIYAFFLNLTKLTKGPFGISAIIRPTIFGINFTDNFLFLLLMIFFLSLSYLLINRLSNSPMGKAFEAMRDDKLATKALGKDTSKLEDVLFSFSAFFAGLSGSLFACYVTFIDPSIFTFPNLILGLLIVVIAGLASLPGTVLATAIIILLPEPLRFLGLPNEIVATIRQLIYASLLMLIINYYPRGFMGKIQAD